MPFRNLVRAPRRTFLTLLALTGVLAILFGTPGLRDSMAEMIDQGEQELLGDDPDRLVVYLDSLYPINSPQVTGVLAGGALRDAEPTLTIAGTVALVQSLGDKFETAKNSLEALSGVALMSELAMLGLALLIAFNTANLNAEERVKDHATMFAYGVPVRRAVFNLCVEGLVLGIVSILLSALFGYALLRWMVTVVFREAFPDVGIPVAFDPARVSAFLVVGGLLVALAPIFGGRKLKRMDIPARLRVTE